MNQKFMLINILKDCTNCSEGKELGSMYITMKATQTGWKEETGECFSIKQMVFSELLKEECALIRS